MSKKDLPLFLKESLILIIESSKDSCENLSNQLIQLGAEFKNIHTSMNKEDARVLIEKTKFQIIFSEYGQISHHGFELFNFAKEKIGTDLLTFVLTSNSSQITVASAAEEEVSDYLLKPIAYSALEEVIEKNYLILKNKNKYIEKISQGKFYLKQGNLEEAEKFFVEAEALHEAPSLACYYLGQVSQLKGNKMIEISHYNRGLTYNSYHYRCLAAVMDFYQNEKRYELSYKVLRRLIEYFPANNERLCLAIYTTIRIGKIDEIKFLYDAYSKIPDVTSELQLHIEAGLYILAKYKIIALKYDEAEKWIKEICRSGSKREFYLANIHIAMMKYWENEKIQRVAFSIAPTLIENKISSEIFQMLEAKREEA